MYLQILFLTFLLINLNNCQLPNPRRYQLTVKLNGTVNEHYAVDYDLGKMSRLWFSNSDDERFGGNQDIYIRNDGKTYTFNFMSYPSQCIANRAGPYREMNYWSNIITGFGGENQTYTEILFDQDCLGACLTWFIKYNATAVGFTVHSRLYIKKSNLTPIKLVIKMFHINTGILTQTDFYQYSNWNVNTIPDSEYDYPLNINTCYYP